MADGVELVSNGISGMSAIVTGAAGGIGLAVAQKLSEDGASVLMVDIDGAELNRQAAALPGARAVVADVSQEAGVDEYVQRALDAHGRIDLFFNNAGVTGALAPITEQTMADFDRVIAVNVRGIFLGLRAVLRVMERQQAGAIVNTASVAGFRSGANTAPYVASKHAVIGMTRSAALEAGDFHVRVNAIAPGWIDTRMTRVVKEELGGDDQGASSSVYMVRFPWAA